MGVGGPARTPAAEVISSASSLVGYCHRVSSDAAPARKRGRPRATAADIEARRQKLIHAAYEVFLEKGYNATSIADITAQAGLGFGTFYKGFENKREILDPVIDYGVQQILGDILLDDVALTITATSLTDFENQLRTIARRIDAAFVARPRLAKFLVLEANTIDDALADRWYGLVELAASLVAGYLERGIESGVLRTGLDVTETSHAVVGIILMAIVRAARDPDAVGSSDKYTDAAISLITSGARAT
ncbi:TetR/AcrR family transcriptional regulator [Nocardiaceae bacterium YC2-7]|uniref:TetR/AcrR family transcriptional regulator n=1 Tax=Antrihabitans stalactiti TaxID=2584121 RepID=A0A848KBZ0_9NOCA|nr:TetR/AcrR family transcriptional regulator [Antrihabitans stalactiti]NMN96403.1 TetR/AcrR family transcriptional regulator [Antrihabitans stalactiti]